MGLFTLFTHAGLSVMYTQIWFSNRCDFHRCRCLNYQWFALRALRCTNPDVQLYQVPSTWRRRRHQPRTGSEAEPASRTHHFAGRVWEVILPGSRIDPPRMTGADVWQAQPEVRQAGEVILLALLERLTRFLPLLPGRWLAKCTSNRELESTVPT